MTVFKPFHGYMVSEYGEVFGSRGKLTPQPDKLAYYEKVADDLQALCDKQSLRIAELEKSWIGLNWDDLPEDYVGDKAFLQGAKWAEAKLREKNT